MHLINQQIIAPFFLISAISKISFWKVVTSFKNRNRPCNFILTFQKHSKYLFLGYVTRFLCILHPHLRKTYCYVCVYSIISFSLCMTIIGYAFEFWNNRGIKCVAKRYPDISSHSCNSAKTSIVNQIVNMKFLVSFLKIFPPFQKLIILMILIYCV